MGTCKDKHFVLYNSPHVQYLLKVRPAINVSFSKIYFSKSNFQNKNYTSILS